MGTRLARRIVNQRIAVPRALEFKTRNAVVFHCSHIALFLFRMTNCKRMAPLIRKHASLHDSVQKLSAFDIDVVNYCNCCHWKTWNDNAGNEDAGGVTNSFDDVDATSRTPEVKICNIEETFKAFGRFIAFNNSMEQTIGNMLETKTYNP